MPCRHGNLYYHNVILCWASIAKTSIYDYNFIKN